MQWSTSCFLSILLPFSIYGFRPVPLPQDRSFTKAPFSTEPPEPTPTTCGYESCHPIKDGFINVHLVPHSHDDVGWLKTVDQYYYGSKTSYQNAGVQYILNTVMDSLGKDINRRFIYVETAFFWKWWIQQHDIVKSKVRKFVKNGQLEFISGGWSMNDEAATHYHSIIDQMTWGLRKLNETFGDCGRPKIGWQIDPFGHSKEMGNIFAQLGFDALLLGRIDYQDKNARWKTQTPEMVWRASSSLGESSDIFTSVMYNIYAPPPGFCFDILCEDEPIIDDQKSYDYNVDQRVDEFLDYVKNVTKIYTTNNIIITMGEDFNYQDAEAWFMNLDKLIYYVNQRQSNGSKFNLIYSTPSCYVKAVHDESENDNKSFRLKQDDFFPYASDSHSYWTGYFTSRPAIKRFERLGNNFLQVCKQLYALADLGPEDGIDLNTLREAMGVMQHHDAVTGTEKQHVADDYARLLQYGIEECEIVTTAALNKLAKNSTQKSNVPKFTCPLANISQCVHTEKTESFVVTIYNPLSRPVDKLVKLPVAGQSYVVTNSRGENCQTDIIEIPDFILNLPGRNSSAIYELYILATDLPPLGWRSYFVTKTHNSSDVQNDNTSAGKIPIPSLSINSKTGLLTDITINNITTPITQNFYYYNGYVGNNQIAENRSSGAYIFRPEGSINKVAEAVTYKTISGNLIAEVHQEYNEYIKQIIRVNKVDNYVEFDWIVGPLPTNNTNGIEVVTRYSSQKKSTSYFYTDSNGKEILKRIRDFRPTWNLNSSEPVSSNYYPVTAKIAIRDESEGFEIAVLNDRAQGGTSLNDGEIELMIHRNSLHDDAFGVGEALNETAYGEGLVVRGSHYLTAGYLDDSKSDTIAAIERDIAQKKLLDTWIFITPLNVSVEQYKSDYITEFSGLRTALPKNVQILTFEPWIGFSFLLRLEHIFEVNEDPILSQPVSVNLKDLFTEFEIESLEETTLGANQWLKDNKRMQFNTSGTLEELLLENYDWSIDADTSQHKLWRDENLYKKRNKRDVLVEAKDNLEDFQITLNPSEIRTFVITTTRGNYY